jgi:hypothetical protein
MADRVRSVSSWRLSPATMTSRRRGSSAGDDKMVADLETTGRVKLASSYEAQPANRRGAGEEALVIEIDGAEAEDTVLMTRHPSGAINFHAAERSRIARRGRTATSTSLRFVIAPGVNQAIGARRGFIQKGIKVFVLKLVGSVADIAFSKLVAAWERQTWKGKSLGLVHVTAAGLQSGHVIPVKDLSRIAVYPKRNLLLIHGTFSSTAGCYTGLASARGTDGRTLFESLSENYEDRIFGFDHFTVSASPEENALKLLDALPERGATFDVITHSRGALVLRTLIELREQFGSKGQRFKANDVVMVAGTNAGTPLAAPERWDTLLSWLSNILELFPENPFTVGLDFIAEGLKWLARNVGERIEGLASMNPDGEVIRQLQAESLDRARMFVIASNYLPTDSTWMRMLDLGVDQFFGSANDLVVPTEGSWKVDPDGGSAIPSDRIGCYGKGGNMGEPDSIAVHHCNYFKQSATVDFLTKAFSGKAIGLRPIPPEIVLPFKSRSRRGGLATDFIFPQPEQALSASLAAAETKPEVIGDPTEFATSKYPADEVLSLFVLDPRAYFAKTSNAAKTNEPKAGSGVINTTPVLKPDYGQGALIIASFRNARVVEAFPVKGGVAGRRFNRIIEMNKRIKKYVRGDPDAEPIPRGVELIDHGRDLFDALFIGRVRRLYDAARAELKDRRLDVVFTSTVGWVADKPWEFAYDPSRRTYICLEDINFIRNTLTAIPADAIDPRLDPLRILVVAAQPIGSVTLSQQEEVEVILRGFQPLIDARLASVEVLTHATPGLLHERLEASEGNPYDILHFIGHGGFDGTTGTLLFEDSNGKSDPIDAAVFRQIIKNRKIRLVFLNACETGTGNQGATGFTAGVAPYLMAGGVPAVVANQFMVLDPSATAFAQHFYWSLAQGRCLGDAAREARVGVNYSVTGEAIDWAVPVVFSRNPGDRLVTKVAATAAGPAERASRKSAGRRSGERRAVQVALWDVNYTLPKLEHIAADLTRAQRTFGFEVADISAPLGTWRRTSEGSFITAEEVYGKLKHTPARLSVDWLICFTTFELQNDEHKDLIMDSNDADIAIISVSTALSKLDPPATTVERLIANNIAFALSKLKNAHASGTKSCVGYFNDEKDIRWSAGQLSICPDCLRSMKKAGASLERIDSIRKLLTAFH